MYRCVGVLVLVLAAQASIVEGAITVTYVPNGPQIPFADGAPISITFPTGSTEAIVQGTSPNSSDIGPITVENQTPNPEVWISYQYLYSLPASRLVLGRGSQGRPGRPGPDCDG